MGFFNSLKNLLMPESVDTASDKLLQWLGIDTDKPKALAETTYFTCLKVLSETMGKMPLKLYQEDESGGRVRAPTADILLYRPNSVMTPSTFWSTMEANCQHYGNAYAWIRRDYKVFDFNRDRMSFDKEKSGYSSNIEWALEREKK